MFGVLAAAVLAAVPLAAGGTMSQDESTQTQASSPQAKAPATGAEDQLGALHRALLDYGAERRPVEDLGAADVPSAQTLPVDGPRSDHSAEHPAEPLSEGTMPAQAVGAELFPHWRRDRTVMLGCMGAFSIGLFGWLWTAPARGPKSIALPRSSKEHRSQPPAQGVDETMRLAQSTGALNGRSMDPVGLMPPAESWPSAAATAGLGDSPRPSAAVPQSDSSTTSTPPSAPAERTRRRRKRSRRAISSRHGRSTRVARSEEARRQQQAVGPSSPRRLPRVRVIE